MSYDIIEAEYLRDYKIRVTFENGKKGVVNFLPFIQKGGVYGKLQNVDFFKCFSINQELGILTWENEIDIAPETLYSVATGEPLPEWMRCTDDIT